MTTHKIDRKTTLGYWLRDTSAVPGSWEMPEYMKGLCGARIWVIGQIEPEGERPTCERCLASELSQSLRLTQV